MEPRVPETVLPPKEEMFNYIIELEAAMHRAAKNLEFEKAAEIRDMISKLRKKE